ncbi:MAG: protoheme IX farnesyltransferase [Candidatus Rokubacteria bacterium]|nr:protoheme IX farnesyltransferase [Candidatus Rokubacteria bacterium]
MSIAPALSQRADHRLGARDRRRVVADLVALTKPRVVLMVLVTTLVGYYIGLDRVPDWARMLHLAVGTALAAGGTLALNQYWEREVDARMARTRSRPLPQGRLAPLEALVFGVAISVIGVGYLAVSVNVLAAVVTGAIVAMYVFVYTPLKLRTALCTLVGALPGALPPVIGWVAARDALGAGAWVLFAIMFAWQLPHALAIAWLYREDYARGGIRVLPVIDPDGTRTERHIAISSVALLVVSLLATPAGIAGPLYFVTAFALGAVFVVFGAQQALLPSRTAIRRVLFASLFYLPLILTVLAVDKR